MRERERVRERERERERFAIRSAKFGVVVFKASLLE